RRGDIAARAQQRAHESGKLAGRPAPPVHENDGGAIAPVPDGEIGTCGVFEGEATGGMGGDVWRLGAAVGGAEEVEGKVGGGGGGRQVEGPHSSPKKKRTTGRAFSCAKVNGCWIHGDLLDQGRGCDD